MTEAVKVPEAAGLSVQEMEATVAILTQNYRAAEAEERNQAALKLKYLGSIEILNQLVTKAKADFDAAHPQAAEVAKKPALRSVKKEAKE